MWFRNRNWLLTLQYGYLHKQSCDKMEQRKCLLYLLFFCSTYLDYSSISLCYKTSLLVLLTCVVFESIKDVYNCSSSLLVPLFPLLFYFLIILGVISLSINRSALFLGFSALNPIYSSILILPSKQVSVLGST